MMQRIDVPPSPSEWGQHPFLLVEAPRGRARREYLQEWMQIAQSRGIGNSWLLPCDFAEGGSFAGLKDLLAALLPGMEVATPSLIARHQDELLRILPDLRRKRSLRHPTLNDLVSFDEKVRTFPAARAYNVLHGIIDLLASFRATAQQAGPWILVCDGCDRAGALVRRFLRELVRRRSLALDLRLLLAIDPGQAEPTALELQLDLARTRSARLDLAPEPPLVSATAAFRQETLALEQRACSDPIDEEIELPHILKRWQELGEPERARRWQVRGLELCFDRGLYEDALVYGMAVLPHLDEVARNEDAARWNIVGNLCICLIKLGRPAEGIRLLENLALPKITDARVLSRIHYARAMFHARHLPQKNLDLAETCIEQALEAVARLSASDEELHFRTVFLHNGRALVLHRKGRNAEALTLCRSGVERLQANLPLERHRLHRYALQHNAARLCEAIGAHDEALAHYTTAISMDPGYPDHYGDRGALYMNLGRLTEAEADFVQAATLGSPSAEAFTNLGQCYRQMERAEEAVSAYTRALDLDPRNALAYVGRAQMREALGDAEAALLDYDAALALVPDDALVLSNRAVLHYEAGRLAAALADLDLAIALSPDNADLHHNRSIALSDLQRRKESAQNSPPA